MSDQTAEQTIVYKLPVIRGICVLAVMLAHATASIRNPFAGAIVPEVFANTLARFAVPLFIAASGFYLSLHPRNQRAWRFYRRALPGLVWPYVFYTVVYALYHDSNLIHLARNLPGELLRGSADTHLWFIPVIIELYLIHPFLRNWYARAGHPGWAVAAALAVQVAYATAVEIATQGADTSRGWIGIVVPCTLFLKCVGFFVAGYWLRDHATQVLSAARRRGAFAAGCIVWIASGSILPAIWASGRMACCPTDWAVWSSIALEVLMIPLTASACVMLIGWRPAWPVPSPVQRAVRICGLYWYGVYYLHLLVLYVLGRTLWTHAGPVMTVRPLRALVLVVLDAVVTVSLVKLLARLPFTRYLT